MNAFTGTGVLTRLALRRDRIFIPAWVAVFVLTAYVSAQATVDLYPTVASRIGAADTINRSQALAHIEKTCSVSLVKTPPLPF